jgi:propanol-preferring alcohol dehydrogenase
LHFYHAAPEDLKLRGKVVGHEPAGVVAEVGDGVTAVQPGDRVSVYHWIGCGHCHYCRSGYRQFCAQAQGIAASGNGSSAEYLLAPEANCLPLPDQLSFVDGALMACCAGTAFASLKRLRVAGGDQLAVFGLGPVGLSVLLEATAMGARVIGVEVVPERISLGRELGAEVVIDASRDDPVSAIRDLTRGRGVPLAVEASGSDAGRAQIVESLDIGGTAVYVGQGSDRPVVCPADLIQRGRTLTGSFVMPMGLYRPLSDFLVDRDVRLERMVTHRFPIDRAVEAFQLFATRKTGKVVIEFA